MNARSILDDELRKKVAHLDVGQIRVLTAQLEQSAFQLKVFLKLFDKQKSPARHWKNTDRALRLQRN